MAAAEMMVTEDPMVSTEHTDDVHETDFGASIIPSSSPLSHEEWCKNVSKDIELHKMVSFIDSVFEEKKPKDKVHKKEKQKDKKKKVHKKDNKDKKVKKLGTDKKKKQKDKKKKKRPSPLISSDVMGSDTTSSSEPWNRHGQSSTSVVAF